MKKVSRRSFVQTSITAATAAIFIPGLKSCSPNSKLNIAIIGVGNRGAANLRGLPVDKDGNKLDNIVALCDVDDEHTAESYALYPNAKRFKDYRVMMDQIGKEIDAVVVSTPDHCHFTAAMSAMQLGKHVYVEKPLAHNIWQLRTLKKAAKYYDVVTQMGNQGHTTEGIRLVKEWYDAGVLGDVREVIAWCGQPQFQAPRYFLKPETYPPAPAEIPAGLDWDLWLGPAKNRHYSDIYIPRTWRGWYDFGNGALGDWACHTLDAPFWALDLGIPSSVNSEFKKETYPDLTPEQSILQYEFPARGNKPPVSLKWYEGGLLPENRPEWGLDELSTYGMIMVGDKKTLMTGGTPNNPKLLLPKDEWEAFTKAIPKRTIPRVPDGKPQIEWVDCIKNGNVPGSNFEYSADLTEMTLLGVMAQRFNTLIEYDKDKMKVVNHPEFDVYVKEPARDGWVYGEELWS